MLFQKLRRIYFGKEYSGKYEDTAQNHFRSDRLLEKPYGEKKSEHGFQRKQDGSCRF